MPSSIFFGYSRQDIEQVQPLLTILKDSLAANGTVFWDHDIPPGEPWPDFLNDQLENAIVVVIAWSKNAIQSQHVFREAEKGFSKGTLVPISLDGTKPPKIMNLIQCTDLSDWNGTSIHPSVTAFSNAVRDRIVHSENVALYPQKRDDAAHTDLMDETATQSFHKNRATDEKGIAEIIRENATDEPTREAAKVIDFAHYELYKSQTKERSALDDRAPIGHMQIAAAKFSEALQLLGQKAHEIKTTTGKKMAVHYYLSMEHANSLCFSRNEVQGKTLRERFVLGIEIYQRILQTYEKDAPASFRLGSAMLKIAETANDYADALFYLNRSLEYAPADGDVDNEDHWIYYAAPHMIGICFWHQSEVSGTNHFHRRELINLAIKSSVDVFERIKRLGSDDSFEKFLATKSASNAIHMWCYLVRTKLVDVNESDQCRANIKDFIEVLSEMPFREYAERQISVMDSLALGASTIHEWEKARDYGKRLNYAIMTIAHERAEASPCDLASLDGYLDKNEIQMRTRAQEILYFSTEFTRILKRKRGFWS